MISGESAAAAPSPPRATLPEPEQRESTAILAVSIDGKEDLDRMVERIAREDGVRPDHTFVSDPDHRVIDREGVVRWKFIEVDY